MPVIDAQAEPIPGYKILHRLGSGGFGEVWKAEAPGGIQKAIKVIFGDLRSPDRDLTRFAEQELKALNRVKQVRHPYLLALDRIDVVDGRLMIVMELCDRNLWDRFRECRAAGLPGVPRPELLGYMAEIAEVLDLMNDRYSLQHLDIKPQNLFLLHTHVKVADFGQVKDLQGMVATVTGGITPVYAAPETFDGVVTKFCDQYSLACVYQELLTGRRPFDGGSMAQLLNQHLQLPPELGPSPREDRPALFKALAKDPAERWPNVTAFVNALRGERGTRNPEPGAEAPSRPSPSAIQTPDLRVPASRVETPAAARSAFGDTLPPGSWPLGRSAERVMPFVEETGPGVVRPAVVVGLGGVGSEVVRRLRFDLAERYGGVARVPAVRTLVVDTDPDALAEAARERPARRLAGVGPDGAVAAPLQRAGYYLKPRLSGGSLVDGWFDPQLLYKLPRLPRTTGLRVFGRLAFCDHARAFGAKLRAELLAADGAAVHDTADRTGLGLRTTRPRVYVVAGLGGGTGGGMVLDAAYAARAELRRLGHSDPEVVGVLVLPPAEESGPALGNAYASLVELNHFSRPGAGFSAHPDGRPEPPEETPPFGRCVLLAGADGPAVAAELLRAELFTTVGRARDECGMRNAECGIPDQNRSLSSNPHSEIRIPHFSAVGLAGFAYPRAAVAGRAADHLAGAVLNRWLTPDPARMRDIIPGWAAERWAECGLDPEAVLARLRDAADRAAGSPVDQQIELTAGPLTPRGWFGRPPAAEAAAVALDRLVRLVGHPAGPGKRPPTAVEEAIARAAAEVAATGAKLAAVAAGLADEPGFRVAGAVEAVRQFLATADRLAGKYRQAAADADRAARGGYEAVARYAHPQPGAKPPAAAEAADAARRFPAARYEGTLNRHLAEVYAGVREALSTKLAELEECRRLLSEDGEKRRRGEEGTEPRDTSPLVSSSPFLPVLPAGCETVDDAVGRVLEGLTPADLLAVDRAVGAVGLAGGGPVGVRGRVRDAARAYLDGRPGGVDLEAVAGRLVPQALTAAEPAWVGPGPWALGEVVIVSEPGNSGPSGPRSTLRVPGSPDEVLVYREYPAVPLAAVPHLGAAGEAAYRALPDATQCTPHSRLDITRWVGPDGE